MLTQEPGHATPGGNAHARVVDTVRLAFEFDQHRRPAGERQQASQPQALLEIHAKVFRAMHQHHRQRQLVDLVDR